MPPDIAITLAAIARPGDTVIITLRDRMDDDELAEFTGQFEDFFETTGIHVAVIEGVVQMVVVRPGDEDIGDWGDGGDKPELSLGHECNTVAALGDADEPLGYSHCGICGRRR